jgi:hypothetical protein
MLLMLLSAIPMVVSSSKAKPAQDVAELSVHDF